MDEDEDINIDTHVDMNTTFIPDVKMESGLHGSCLGGK